VQLCGSSRECSCLLRNRTPQEASKQG
jgi:hypothetical protein